MKSAGLFFMAGLFLAAVLAGKSTGCYAQDASGQVRCVVLDPGHGGHDTGCMSFDRRYKEKDIVLSVVLKLGKIINEEHPDVKVIYTRKTDVFIPLAERADIANHNKADLFISVHVNANPSAAPYGSETYTMGAHVSGKNFEVSKRENAVIKLEDDYSSKYEGFNPDSPESYIIFSLLQNAYSQQSIKLASYIQDEYKKGPVLRNRGVRQAGFLVLWRTTMPSVLTEIGFLTNQSDKAKIITESGQQMVARRLADAFTRYCKDYSNQTSDSEQNASEQNVSEQKDSEQKDSEQRYSAKKQTVRVLPELEEVESSMQAQDVITYSVQILASRKKLKATSRELKGTNNVNYIYDNGFYKYYTGSYKSRQQAQAELGRQKKKFGDAFIIAIKNGKIVGR